VSQTTDFREWQGREVRASDGEKIGNLEDVYFDSETGDAMFVLVKSGLLGRHLALVPVQEIRPGQSYLQVARSSEDVKQAPTLDPGADLSAEDEARIYRYYGLEYESAASGHRLVRR
jgi:hypothetical protein